jgi:hypothetical protein
MEEAISQSTKAFHDFQEIFLKSNVLDQAPELRDSLHSTAETIVSLTQAIALVQDIDSNNPGKSTDSNTSGSSKHVVEKTQGQSTSEKGGMAIMLKQQFTLNLVTIISRHYVSARKTVLLQAFFTSIYPRDAYEGHILG